VITGHGRTHARNGFTILQNQKVIFGNQKVLYRAHLFDTLFHMQQIVVFPGDKCMMVCINILYSSYEKYFS